MEKAKKDELIESAMSALNKMREREERAKDNCREVFSHVPMLERFIYS